MAKIKKSVVEDVQTYIDQLANKKGPDKVGRLLAKSYGADAKLNRFLVSKLDQGLGFFTDKLKRNKLLAICDENYGFTSIQEKQAMAIKILQSDVEDAVEAKRLEVTAKGTMVLNDEQKAALTKKLVEYRTFMLNTFMPQALQVAEGLGVIENEVAVVPAQVS